MRAGGLQTRVVRGSIQRSVDLSVVRSFEGVLDITVFHMSVYFTWNIVCSHCFGVLQCCARCVTFLTEAKT